MLGVRLGAVCTIVLGGMLASSAADAAQACDQRLPRTCKAAATQSNRESPKATSAQRPAATSRSRRVARQRHGTKHAQSAKPARRAVEGAPTPRPAPAPAPAPSVVAYVQESSPAARRFSEFVSPRLLAANPVEELHKPRMNVSEFSGQTAYPVVDGPVVDGVDRGPNGPTSEPGHVVSRSAANEVELAQACGKRYGVTANSGTSVTMLTLDAIGVGHGDEVVMVSKAGLTVRFSEDDARSMGPHFQGDQSLYFLALNSGKRSIERVKMYCSR